MMASGRLLAGGCCALRLASSLREDRMPGYAEYGLLGPLTVRRAGVEVPIPAGKQQVVLAALLLRGGRVAGIGELAEALWGEQPPPSARVGVQNYVGRLRQALGPGGDAVIVTGPGGYRIDLGPCELDADRFETALAAGQAAARAGDWVRAAGTLREGLALWRGEPLAGVDSEALAVRDGARLAELRWQATEALTDADLHLGRHREVIAGLRQLTAEQPLRERLHALLMLALYRDGQQAAALAAYQAARNVLAAELGAEAGPELQGLHQQILNADPALAGPEPAGPGRLDARYALPPDTAAFTGRDAELNAITGAVTGAAAAGGVVAIRAIGGMPGIGKTALAVHAAHRLAARFPDRQLLINLHGHTPGQDPVTPEDALAGLLSVTGLDPRALPGDLAGRAALWRHQMAREKALLILDNAASSAQVAPLLPGAAGCLVLVTSRRHLGDLPGAVPVLLETLPPAKAAEMFLRLAPRAAAPGDGVAELTELAGYLPLAISLLARLCARHPSWTLADLAAETRASLLTLAAERDSVAAAFDISYRHLPPARQQFFRDLSLNPGSTTDAYAAAALAGIPPGEAAAHLDALHGEGLLTETGHRRYGMHDLLRRYARGHAAAGSAESAGQALERLLDYYQHAAARANGRLARQARPGPPAAVPAGLPATPDLDDDIQALAWTRAEHANLLACLDHAAAGHHPHVVALTSGLAELWRRDGPWAEAITRHAAAARAAQGLGNQLGQAYALSDLGVAQRLTGAYPAAARAQEQALAIFRDLGDRLGQANTLGNLGIVRRLTGDYPAAAQGLEQALAIFRDLGDRHGEAEALNERGMLYRVSGELARAEGCHRQALELARAIASPGDEAHALAGLGRCAIAADHAARAGARLRQALEIFQRIGAAEAPDVAAELDALAGQAG
jgi:DNA-binding SARP family transcriptional activator